MENLQWPRVVYHKTNGTRRAEKGTGTYTYQSCGSLEEFKALGPGWKLTPEELNEPDPPAGNIYPDAPVQEPPIADAVPVDKPEPSPQLPAKKKVARKTR